MNCCRKVTKDISWVGVNDRRIQRFENMFPLSNGVSYNSYIILGEKTCVMDAVDQAGANQYVENVQEMLDGRQLDYLVVQHMEPDHCGSLLQLLTLHPETRIVGNKKTFTFFEQFYNKNYQDRYLEVSENDEIDLGGYVLRFIMAPNVHWPEVMVTYEAQNKVLFSADAFGSFGVIEGNLFSDEVDMEQEKPEMRRYYANIVGRQGPSVLRLYKKLEKFDIHCICPLHGRLFRQKEHVEKVLVLHQRWASYEPEEKGLVIAFSSMYGNLELLMDKIALRLSEKGLNKIRMFDVSQTHPSFVIAEIYRYSHFLIGANNYNTELYFGVDALIREMLACACSNRKYALAVSRSWGGRAEAIMKDLLSSGKNLEQLGETFNILSALKEDQEEELKKFCDVLLQSIESKE